MTYRCETIDRPAQSVLSIRTRAAVQDLPQVMGKAYGAIMQYLGELGVPPAGAPFVAYFNMDMQDLDMEIGFPVMQPLPGKGEIQPSEIPGGKAATCLHTGSYPELSQAYQALYAWVNESGYQATGASYEFYLNDPEETPPEKLQTQIVFPLVN